MSKDYEITIINPRGKPKRPKKRAKKVAKKRARKKATGRKRAKRRTSNPRRRRRSSRRRSNPWMPAGPPKDAMRASLYRLGGKALAAFAVQRFGDPPTDPTSSTTGMRWSMKNMVIAYLAAGFGSSFMEGRSGKMEAQWVFDGALDLITTKLFWSDIVQRLPGGNWALGQGDALAQAAAQGTEGDILDDGSGNRFVLQQGKWVAMQGLQEATPLGGLQAATPLGDHNAAPHTPPASYGTGVASQPWMGHIMSASNANDPASQWGATTWRGSADPYAAAYS